MRSKGRSARFAWRTRTSAPCWCARRAPLQKQTVPVVPTTTTITTTCSTLRPRLTDSCVLARPGLASTQQQQRADAVPAALRCATIKKMDRASAYRAFRVVTYGARSAVEPLLGAHSEPPTGCGEAVDAARVKLLEDAVERGDGVGDIGVAATRAELDKLNKRIVADWWELNDELPCALATAGSTTGRMTARVLRPTRPHCRDWLERNNFSAWWGHCEAASGSAAAAATKNQVVDRGGKKVASGARSTFERRLSTWLAVAVIGVGLGRWWL